MDTPPEALPIEEIVRRYPNQWVLVEDTAWDTHGHPTAGLVRAASVARGDSGAGAPLSSRPVGHHLLVLYR